MEFYYYNEEKISVPVNYLNTKTLTKIMQGINTNVLGLMGKMA